MPENGFSAHWWPVEEEFQGSKIWWFCGFDLVDVGGFLGGDGGHFIEVCGRMDRKGDKLLLV